jgi:4-amino-4-deoxy-L-arabinose transferase-like glycosyltransferase
VLVFIACVYLLLREWFKGFIGTIGTLLFASLPWVIILGRNATPDVMLLAPAAIIATYTWLKRTERWHNLAWLTLTAVTAAAVYTPGIIWFALISLIVGHRQLIKSIKKTNKALVALGIIMFLLLLTPLVLSAVKDSSILKDLALVPNMWPNAIDLAKSFCWSILSFVWQTPQHIPYIIDRLPILDLAQITLSIVGIYAMWSKARRTMTGLLGLTFIGVALATINKNIIPLTLTFPAIAVFVAAGLRYLYVKWFRVFPKNPLPRTLAIVLISMLVLSQVAYGIRYALIAWPHTMDTRKVYVLK